MILYRNISIFMDGVSVFIRKLRVVMIFLRMVIFLYLNLFVSVLINGFGKGELIIKKFCIL